MATQIPCEVCHEAPATHERYELFGNPEQFCLNICDGCEALTDAELLARVRAAVGDPE